MKLGGRRISGSFRDTLAEARESFNDALERHQSERTDFTDENWTVGAWVFYVLDSIYRSQVGSGAMRKNTWKLYKDFYAGHIAPHPIAGCSIHALRPLHVSQWMSHLQTKPIIRAGKVVRASRPMAPASQARMLGMLKAILEIAVTNRILQINPARGVKRPIPVPTPIRVLSADEVTDLIETARRYDEQVWLSPNGRSHPSARHRTELIVLLGLHGLGPAEMTGLERSHWDGASITVIQQNNASDGLTKALKTRTRAGVIPVADNRLAGLLDAIPGRFLFETANGTPLSVHNLRRVFKAMTKGTPFDGMHPYELRHTCAQRMIEMGIDPRTASEIMRHSVETMLKVYVRSNDALKRTAIQAVIPQKEPKKRTQDPPA